MEEAFVKPSAYKTTMETKINAKPVVDDSEGPQPEKGDKTERWSVIQNINLDPFSCCFETDPRWNNIDDYKLVTRILQESGVTSLVHKRLVNDLGCFKENEAFDVMLTIWAYVNKKYPDAVDYDSASYYDNPDDDVPPGYKWAVGVILYYLLCGIPVLKTVDQEVCYDRIGIGTSRKQPAGRNFMKYCHKVSSKQWKSISVEAKMYIKELTHYYPGNRLTNESAFEPETEFRKGNYTFYNKWMIKMFEESHETEECPFIFDDIVATRENMTMDVCSFKKIIECQKREMQELKEAKSRNPDPKQLEGKKKWETFMTEAAKVSRKKKRKLNAARKASINKENDEKEAAIQQWLDRYYRRFQSEDDYELYYATPVPNGAWGRVE